MPHSLKGRSCLTLEEFTGPEIRELIDAAVDLKRLKRLRVFPKALANRNIAGIFLKPSTRTRTSFVVAASDEGAHLEMFGADEIRFGQKESVRDIARVMGRMFDGIAFRGFAHATAEELAAYAGVPVWNGLSDDHHPTQVLADLMTLQEAFGELEGLRLAYIGDGRNNVVTSLIVAACKIGLELRVIAPPALQPAPTSVAARLGTCHRRARVQVMDEPEKGLAGCDAVYGDVWVSMGEPKDVWKERIKLLTPYQVNAALMKASGNSQVKFMH